MKRKISVMLPFLMVLIPFGNVWADDDQLAHYDNDWWQNVSRDIRTSEYRIRPVADGRSDEYSAINRAQGFRISFSNGGVGVTPRVETGGGWEITLSLIGVEQAGAVVSSGISVVETSDRSVVIERGELTETVTNQEHGLSFDVELPAAFARDEASVLLYEINTDLDFRAEPGSARVAFYRAGERVAVLSVQDSLDEQSVAPAIQASGNQLRISPSQLGEDASRVKMALQSSAAEDTQVGPSLTPDWVLDEEQSGSDFGFVVAPAGDVNGDGFSDVIVGAPNFSLGQANVGRVLVYQGSPNGLSIVPAWSADGEVADGRLGSSVAPSGRVNGDEFSDIIVGVPGDNTARIYLGSANGLLATPQTLRGDSGEFGHSVAGAGDVNADGLDDVIVGAPDKDGGETVVFFAPFDDIAVESSCLTVPQTCFQTALNCPNNNDDPQFGFSVASAGDVNEDGFSDIIVGAPSYLNVDPAFCSIQIGAGAAFVYRGLNVKNAIGSSCLDAADWCSIRRDEFDAFAGGESGGAQIGYSVSTAGDVNGDGKSDVIVGAPLWNHEHLVHTGSEGIDSQSNVGGAIVYPATGDSTLLDKDSQQVTNGVIVSGPWAVRGSAMGGGPDVGDAAMFGASVASAGDVNGDGIDDIIIGALGVDTRGEEEGVALVFLGSSKGLPLATDEELGAVYGDANDNNIKSDVALPGNADWVVTGVGDGGRLGRSVATAGDVDGDGFTDLLIGDRDHAFVYRGSGFTPGQENVRPLGRGWVPDSIPNCIEANVRITVASAGDVNGDGYGDTIVGVPDCDRVFVYYGPNLGIAFGGGGPNPDWQLIGMGGHSVASAGDVNGDGFGDIVVGDPEFDGAFVDSGRAMIFLSNPEMQPAVASWVVEGRSLNAQFGQSVDTAGDVNGDGYSDVIVGSPGANTVSVYTGSANGPSVSGIELDGVGGEFGFSVASAGDVNADGFGDVIVGAPDSGGVLNDGGNAYIYLGSLTNPLSTLVRQVGGIQTGAEFGYSVGSAGDVNGDGFGDVVIGAPGFDSGQSGTGRVFVHLGELAGLQAGAVWTSDGVVRDSFGHSVASAGDVNGDGLSDVLVGSGNGALMYLGVSSGLGSVAAWSPAGNSGVVSVTGVGDINGDGFDDVAAGVRLYLGNVPTATNSGPAEDITVQPPARRPQQLRVGSGEFISPLGRSDIPSQFRLRTGTPQGQGKYGLEWEVKELRSAFDGQSLESGPVETVIDPEITVTVGSLSGAIPYRWRARILTDSPFAPRSPWFSSPGGPQGASLVTAGVRTPPAFASIGPAPNTGVFADSPPLNFIWNVGSSNNFEMQWSSDGSFTEPLVSSGDIPVNGADFGLYTPDTDTWKSALGLAQSPDFREAPLFWRLIATGGAESEVRTIRIAPNEAPAVVSPGDDQTVDLAPTLIWQANHNDRYQIRFSANSHIGDPRIIVGDSDGSADSESDYNITTSECASTPDFCFTVPASLWTDIKSLSAAGGDGTSTVYFSVFAHDTLGRKSFSPVLRLKIINPGVPAQPPSNSKKSGGGSTSPIWLLLLGLPLFLKPIRPAVTSPRKT